MRISHSVRKRRKFQRHREELRMRQWATQIHLLNTTRLNSLRNARVAPHVNPDSSPLRVITNKRRESLGFLGKVLRHFSSEGE